MKLTRLSLVAGIIAGLTTTSFAAADTLSDAFKNGQVSGELRAYYFDRDGSPDNSTTTTKANLLTTGVILKYITDSLYGFKVGMTVQSSYAPFADEEAKDVFKGDMWGSGVQFSEAYLQYTFGKTKVKIGRQFIGSPLVAGSPSRMVTQSFEGATITTTEIPDTMVMAGVITKYQTRTDGAGNISEFGALDAWDTEHNHAYTVFVVNNSLPNTTIKAQWAGLNTNDNTIAGGDIDLFYGEVNYKVPVNDFTYGLAFNTEYKSATTKSDGFMYGAMASLGYKDFNTYFAYTVITDEGDIYGTHPLVGGIGGGAQTTFAHGYQNKYGIYTRDTNLFSFDANYKLKQYGLLIGARYTGVENNYIDKDYGYTDLYTVYDVQALQGLTFDVSYQDWSKDCDGHDLWFKAIYKF